MTHSANSSLTGPIVATAEHMATARDELAGLGPEQRRVVLTGMLHFYVNATAKGEPISDHMWGRGIALVAVHDEMNAAEHEAYEARRNAATGVQ